MATYKVIQDIEAEDKFIGPLTLKQFIFGAAAALFAYLNIFALSKNAAWMLTVFVPPMLLAAFLAIPWSRDQSTEVWVLAKLRFYFKPRRHIWDQSGMQDLVTVTAPKKIERQLTNNLSETEVTSRLEALASTIDTRGWAVKNATLADALSNVTSDRLVGPTILPEQSSGIDLAGVTDVMDSDESTVAANVDNMIKQSDAQRKSQNLDNMNRVRQGAAPQSLHKPEVHFTPPAHIAAPIGATPIKANSEAELTQQLRARTGTKEQSNSHLRTIPTLSQQKQALAQSTDDNSTTQKPQAPMPATPRPDIIDLSRNDDLSVATIAKEANRDQDNDNEVVISLR